MNPAGALSKIGKAAKKGLGEKAAEAALKAERSARDEAIIEASKAAKRGFLNPSKDQRLMYHATTEDFSEFQPNRRGAHFVTPSTQFANEFLGILDEASEVPAGANIMPVHVQARNPFDYENPEHVEMIMGLARFPKSVDQQAVRDNIELGSFGFIEDQNVQKAIKDAGFDSFYIKERGVKNLGVFEPTQIKSATGMGGSYDITDPDITKAKGGAVDHDLKAWHQKQMAAGGAVAPEVLGGGTGLPMKKGGAVDHDLIAWHKKMAAGGIADSYQTQQASQAKKSSDIQAYKEGKIGADELVKYYPGMTATMVEEQLNPSMAGGGDVSEARKALELIQKTLGEEAFKPIQHFMNGGEVKMSDGGKTPTIKELLMGKKAEVPEWRPIEQTPLEKGIGWLGQKAEAAGKAMGEATAELKKTHPIKSALAEFFVSDPLQSAGTAMQDWTGTPRDVPPRHTISGEEPKGNQFTPSPIYGGKTLQTFKVDPRVLDVMGFGQTGIAAAGKAAKAVSKMVGAAPSIKPLPAGLSTEPVGTPIERAITPAEVKPKVEEIKAPANDLGLYSATEKASLNLQRKQGNGDAFLNDLKKLGASKEELEYSGMEEFLKGKKSVTRDDIQDFAKNNRYNLTEIEYKQGKGSTDEMEFRGDAIEDQHYIDDRANDYRSEFDDIFPGRREKITEDIEGNYTPEELADPGIRADINNKIEEAVDDYAYRMAQDEYWENPYYQYRNDLGYEVVGNDDSGWSVRDPDGNPVSDWHRNRESAEGAANQDAIERGLVSEGQTKYQDYQLPLGDNYRELLIQNQVRNTPNFTDAERRFYDNIQKKLNTPKTLEEIEASGNQGPLTKEEIQFLDDFEARVRRINQREEFSGPHWDEPDVIAHMRVQDRLTTDQKPMLYVDEMQSDWHQEGSKYGYKDKEYRKNRDQVYKEYTTRAGVLNDINNKAHDFAISLTRKLSDEFIDRMGRTPTRNEFQEIQNTVKANPEYIKLKEEAHRLDKELEPYAKEYSKLSNAVVDAPFKDTWHELGIKRMLNYAAQNGYDRVGFSSASPQIKRWGTQEIAWEKAPKFEKTKEDFAKWMKSKAQEEVPPYQFDAAVNQSFGDPLNGVYKAFLKEVESPQGWKVAATEQRGGMAGRVNLEAEARARGILKEQPTKTVSTQKELREIIDSTTRGMSEEQIDRLTKKTWERMQKFDTGMTAPREEGMRAFYDQKMKNTLQKYAEKIGARFYESGTRVGRGVTEGGGYADIVEPVYVIEFTDKAKKSAMKGQSYKKGGLVTQSNGWKLKGVSNKRPPDERLKAWHKEQKMAAGGIAKAAKAAAKAGKRMSRAEAEAAGYWHPISETKLAKPIGEYKPVVVEDPAIQMLERQIISPEEMQGGVAIPLVGDRAAAGRIIQEIEGTPMNVRLEGGPDFMRLHPGAAWASGKGVLSMLADRVRMARESGQPIYGVYTAMSPQAVDFNTMMTESLLNQLDISDLRKKDIKEFDQAVKMVKGQGGKPKAPNFPGLDDPELREKLIEGPGGQRDAFVKAMSKAEFQKKGFPDVAAARLAVTEPELLETPRGSAGYTIAKLDPEARIVEQSGHTTYPLDILGEYIGGFETQLPVESMYPSHFEAKRLMGSTPTGAHKSLELFAPLQYLDQNWLDQAMQYMEMQKKLQGRKQGGLAHLS